MKLNEYLDLKGISRSWLAKKINMTRQSLSNKLHGNRGWTLEDVKAIAKVLEFTDKQIVEIFLR